MLKCVENWGPRHPPKRVPWARCQKICKFTLYIYIFLRNQTRKNYNRAKVIQRCYYICFFNSSFSTCPKKMNTEKWPKAADSPLPLGRVQGEEAIEEILFSYRLNCFWTDLWAVGRVVRSLRVSRNIAHLDVGSLLR